MINGQWKPRLHVDQWAGENRLHVDQWAVENRLRVDQWAVENRLHVDQWAVENRLHVDQWAVENRTTDLSCCRLLMEHLAEERKRLTVIVSCSADSLLR